MKDILKEYQISFPGLPMGESAFRYSVGQDFFDRFGYSDNWSDARLEVQAVLTKRSNMMELDLSFAGTILVPCDVTDIEFRLPLEGSQHLLVKQGEVPGEEDDVVTIAWEDTSIDIAQYIYEMVVLSVPAKRYHPDYLSGEIPAPAMSSGGIAPDADPEEPADPRWAKLKDIKN